MFALMYLAIAATMIGIAIWVGLAAYRGTQRRWVQVVVTIVVLWLPFWDVAPGLYLYHKAIREVGGVRIHRTVRAREYLNSACGPCRSEWKLPVETSWRHIADRSTNEIIAESHRIHFVSWLARRILIPQWHYNGISEPTYIEFNIRNVIQP